MKLFTVRTVIFVIFPDTGDIINWPESVKEVQFERFEWIIFLPYYKDGRKIIAFCTGNAYLG